MWILVSILGILLLLAWTPVGLRIQYSDRGPIIHARLGPIHISLVPKPEKRGKRTRRTKRPKRKSKAAQKEPAGKKGLKGGSLELLQTLLPVGLDLVACLRRKLVVEELRLYAWVGGTDPCTTAINYGRAWAAIGCLVPLLENSFTIHRRDIQAVLSQEEPPVTITAYATLHLRLYQIFALGFHSGVQVVKVFLNRQKQKRTAKQAA